VNALERCLHSTLRRACYHGFWFSPEREALQAPITETQREVTRLVRLKLYKGKHHHRRPQKPEKFVRSGDRDHGRRPVRYDQADATGFIRLNALRLKVRPKEKKRNRHKIG